MQANGQRYDSFAPRIREKLERKRRGRETNEKRPA